MLHVSRYVSVPIAAIVVWVLVVYGTYRIVEKIFLVACAFYLSYVASAFLAKPDWLFAAKQTVVPSIHMNTPYLLMLIGLVGTTIAPWQFFYMQASFVEKRVGPRQYKHARMDVLVGSVSCMVIVFFIIVCCAATLNLHGLTNISSAKEAAQALVPLAGKWAGMAFRLRLAERVAFRGVDSAALDGARDLRRPGIRGGPRPQIQGSADVLFAVHDADRGRRGDRPDSEGAALENPAVLAGRKRHLAAVVLIFILLLINRKDLMGEHTNTVDFQRDRVGIEHHYDHPDAGPDVCGHL